MRSFTDKLRTIQKQLLREALHLTGGRENLSHELVQRVWEKVYCEPVIAEKKIHFGYLKQVLVSIYYDRQREKYRQRSHIEEIKNEIKLASLVDDKDYEEKLKMILSFLEMNKLKLKGWIWLELIKHDCDLKKLSQYTNIKYNSLWRAKKRLDKKLRETFAPKENPDQSEDEIKGGGGRLLKARYG